MSRSNPSSSTVSNNNNNNNTIFRRVLAYVYELITVLYMGSIFYSLFVLFWKLSVNARMWLVVILSLVLNLLTLGILVQGVGMVRRLSSLFSIALENDPSTDSLLGNSGNSPNSPTWVVVPLSFMVRNTDEDILAVVDESLQLSSQSEIQRRRDPPNEEKLRQMETYWSSHFIAYSATQEDEEVENCMVCLQSNSVMVPPIRGSVSLTCQCGSVFHKKCILEWFYFVEKHSQEEEEMMIVTCPNCRHVFTRDSSILPSPPSPSPSPSTSSPSISTGQPITNPSPCCTDDNKESTNNTENTENIENIDNIENIENIDKKEEEEATKNVKDDKEDKEDKDDKDDKEEQETKKEK